VRERSDSGVVLQPPGKSLELTKQTPAEVYWLQEMYSVLYTSIVFRTYEATYTVQV